MQERLFGPDESHLDVAKDPYAKERAVANRLAPNYGISIDEVFDLLLAYGSEDAVRRALKQRWWRGEIDRLDEMAA